MSDLHKDRYAVIDLGTNTFHLLVVEPDEQTGFREVFRQQQFIKLAENGMEVGPAGDALSADFRKIGETMMKEWLERAGAKGQGVIDSYKKM